MSVCHTGKVKIHCDFWRNFLSITTFSFPLPPAVCLCACVLSRFSRVRLFVTPWTVVCRAPLSMGIFQGKNPGVGCHDCLQGIFPTQGLNPSLLHSRRILYCLNHQGSPRILEWAAYPFSRGSSWPRNWTGVSCIAGRSFTSWATGEVPFHFILQSFFKKIN